MPGDAGASLDSGAVLRDASTEASDASAEASTFTLRPGGDRPSVGQFSTLEKEQRTHRVRVARIEKLLRLARARSDNAALSRARFAARVEAARHASCAGEPMPTPEPSAPPVSIAPSMCRELDDATGPYDIDVIAGKITQANAEAQLRAVEAELHIGEAGPRPPRPSGQDPGF
jgi:hypothetical protein